MTRTRALFTAALVLACLSGCSGAPTPASTASSGPVNHAVQASVEGEWVVTRTVVSTDDANNPAHAAGQVSTRFVRFESVVCADGPCSGSVVTGPTQEVRDTGTFTSSGDVVDYTLTGFLNCLDQETGDVIVPNGYSYTAKVTLSLVGTDENDPTRATTLEGTLTYTDTVTNEALASGCSREPVTTTTTYTLTAVRGTLEGAPSPTPTPAP